MSLSTSKLADVLRKRHAGILEAWLGLQAPAKTKVSAAEQQETLKASSSIIGALKRVAETESLDSIAGAGWEPIKEVLTELSETRAKSGYSPSETATFVFSLKPAIYSALEKELAGDGPALSVAVKQATDLLDKLGLFTIEVFLQTREEVVQRQQNELLELSTPVVRLWDNILALPLIGTLDSARTQVVMQNLLEAIVQTRSDYAIIDITGVPVVDTLVAQHLLKTVAAARLMGADCLISGIRPQIAQTIIHLGVDLTAVTTKATLADAFSVALKRGGLAVVRDQERGTAPAR
jgi:rsbT co-antagonist protein RsbR